MKCINSYLIFLLGLIGVNPIITYANAITHSNVNSKILQPALTPLNAQFETIECVLPCKNPKTITWWMLRTPTQVELKKANSHNSELWTWENDQATYQFLMHDEKKVIEYSAVDLKMLNMAADSNKWQAVTNLVLQKDLTSMKKTRLKKQYKGLALTQYNGSIEGIKTQIVWIDSLQIPLQITYFYPKHKTIVNLLDVNTSTSASLLSEQILDSYQRIDYADIGDMEHSALAKKWLSKAQDAPGIDSEHH